MATPAAATPPALALHLGIVSVQMFTLPTITPTVWPTEATLKAALLAPTLPHMVTTVATALLRCVGGVCIL